MQRAPGIPHALKGAGDKCKPRAHRAAGSRSYFPLVIAREGGRSSIPETLMMESRSRGVLDTRLEPVIGPAKGRTRWLVRDDAEFGARVLDSIFKQPGNAKY